LLILRAIGKQVLQALDIFFFLASPLMILMFIIAVIILLDYGGQHYNLVKTLQEQGVQARAEVVDAQPTSLGIPVVFNQPDYGEQYLFIKVDYYSPRVIESLHAGDQVAILYLPKYNESRAVLADHFADVKHWCGFAVEPLWMMLIACLAVIVHPEVLYIGYIRMDEIFKTESRRKS
jgi:hypothetical protein